MGQKAHYEKLFSEYPDVVNMAALKEMFGGISRGVLQRLIRENKIKHFMINEAYLIPKVWAIEYLMSDDYVILKKRLKSHIKE